MVSAGLPFLLLVSSALLIYTASDPTSVDQNQLQERSPRDKDIVKEWFKKIRTRTISNMDRITKVVCPSLEIIPVLGPMIKGYVEFAASEIKGYSEMDLLMDEFENLNTKLDQYHVEQKWDIWSSSVYHKPETEIDVAWDIYTALLRSLRRAKDVKEKGSHIEDFKNAYSRFEQATNELHKLLIAKGDGFKYPLGDLLAENAHCHEKTISHYTMFIIKLIYKGNTMNAFYYKLKKTESEPKAELLAKYAYEAASVMFEVHQQCILNSINYIIKDVEMLINKTEKRSELAKQVWSSLVKDYDRYDWMVVAFITKNSEHEMFKVLNNHILSGFTVITKNRVSVAVARQVKGTHTKAHLIKQAIKKCIDKSVLCYKVPKTLAVCSESLEGKPVSQTYTAVHAHLSKSHDSHNAQEIPDYDFNLSPEDSLAQTDTPYIYRGECKRFLLMTGTFVVLIKSDEEIMAEDSCSKLDCGEKENRGSCVPVKDMFLAMCQCNKPYYGENCEESLEDYKKYLQGNIYV